MQDFKLHPVYFQIQAEGSVFMLYFVLSLKLSILRTSYIEILHLFSVRECNPLSPPEKGDVTPDICKIKPLHGQKCSFVCNAGYTRIGPSFSSCDDGYWIPGSFTVCKGTVTTLRVVEFNDGPFYRLVFYCLTYLAKFF